MNYLDQSGLWGIMKDRNNTYVRVSTKNMATRTYLDKDGNAKKIQKQEDRQYSIVIGNEKVSVCKKIFSKTLCVGASFIDHAINNKHDGHFVGQDHRGKHKQDIKTHIGSCKKTH